MNEKTFLASTGVEAKFKPDPEVEAFFIGKDLERMESHEELVFKRDDPSFIHDQLFFEEYGSLTHKKVVANGIAYSVLSMSRHGCSPVYCVIKDLKWNDQEGNHLRSLVESENGVTCCFKYRVFDEDPRSVYTTDNHSEFLRKVACRITRENFEYMFDNNLLFTRRVKH